MQKETSVATNQSTQNSTSSNSATQLTSNVAPVGATGNGAQLSESAGIIELRRRFDAAITHPDFISNANAVTKAIKALEIPDPYARFRRQFHDVARRNLLAKAKVDEHGNIRQPSKEAIAAEVERLILKLQDKRNKTAPPAVG